MIKKYVFRAYLLIMTILFSQIPLFVNQYTIRLESHYKEIQRTFASLEKAAASVGKTLPEYRHKFLISEDPVFHSQGIFIKSIEERVLFLEQSLYTLMSVNSVVRPFYFFIYADKELIEETKTKFEYGIIWNEVTILWGLFGCVVAAVLSKSISRLCFHTNRQKIYPHTKNPTPQEVPYIGGDV